MQSTVASSVDNPFMLMLDPQRVRQDMERSVSLRSLGQRTCHPLDRPVLRALSIDLVEVDEQIEREASWAPVDEFFGEPLAD